MDPWNCFLQLVTLLLLSYNSPWWLVFKICYRFVMSVAAIGNYIFACKGRPLYKSCSFFNIVHCSSLSLRRQFLVAVTLDLQSFFSVCLKRGWPSLVNWLHHQTKQYMRWATCLYYPILTNEICVMGTSLAYTLCGFCEMFSSVKMTNAHLWNVWAFPVLWLSICALFCLTVSFSCCVWCSCVLVTPSTSERWCHSDCSTDTEVMSLPGLHRHHPLNTPAVCSAINVIAFPCTTACKPNSYKKNESGSAGYLLLNRVTSDDSTNRQQTPGGDSPTQTLLPPSPPSPPAAPAAERSAQWKSIHGVVVGQWKACDRWPRHGTKKWRERRPVNKS